MDVLISLRRWPARRWLVALGTAVATYLFIALPTDLVPNPVFGREIPPTAWSYWALAVSAILSGLLAATYVATPEEAKAQRDGKLGMAGAFVTFFAVGCPVCNKLVLLALGYTGAIQFFEPIQPYLAVGAIVLLGWALVSRVRNEYACTLPRRERVDA
ncbi:hypothetical protein QQX09_00935 [Demequina sp. SYSU T00192]|uniref:Integral membrane protein n=1 Tax=Demequina litoralis TaxID=3051660 RepID=A0ABT8G5M0_9MICO|nr:hypothetical protein [Demequina sp. SYSU T00192]MDN4474413.1 hypothetical protein [Demequina sp. SYSU T00192]